MPACTSAASKPEKNLSSDQVAPDSSIPMCRWWKDSQQPNRVSTFLHAIREQPASNADSGPNICDQRIQSDATAEAPLLRPQRRRGNITMVCGCSARLCSLSWAAEKCLCLADAQHRQPACLGAALSIWLKSHQHNAGILWPYTFVFLLFQFLYGSMFPNILSFPQTMLLPYILNGTGYK